MAKIIDHYRKVGTPPGLRAVERHNSREGAYDEHGKPVAGKWEDILTHPERRGLNEIHGDGVGVLQARRDRIAAVDLKRKPQRNAAAAVEVTISASPDWFEGRSLSVQKLYFSLARNWLESKFGKEQILGWAVHYDETTPHMHVLLVPLTKTKEIRERKDGKDVSRNVVKSAEWSYSSSRFLGGPAGLIKLHDELAKDLAPMGVERGIQGSKARHTNQQQGAAQLAAREAAVEKREMAAEKREAEISELEATVAAGIKLVALEIKDEDKTQFLAWAKGKTAAHVWEAGALAERNSIVKEYGDVFAIAVYKAAQKIENETTRGNTRKGPTIEK